MTEHTAEIAWPGHLTDPQHVESRADQLMAIARQGFADMGDPDLNVRRIILGFYGVVVFGRSVTLALQHLRTFGPYGVFDTWYTPWTEEMRQDELCKFFYDLRSALLHDIAPMPGVVMASFSAEGLTGPASFTYDPAQGPGFVGHPNVIPPGTVRLGDYPLPTRHRGQPLTDTDLRTLADLYLRYLAEMMKSVRPVIASIQARWRVEHPWQTPQSS